MEHKVVELDASKGLYIISGKVWSVGRRYQLLEYIGGGSYGDVCQSIDCQTSQTVALKRVPDILCSPLLAKRVLREVCIMRRLSHPYIITLTDVFTNSSNEVKGGLDLYIATEFADRGDMYHLRDSISANDVKSLVWQLLMGIRYMHSCRVWHRDMKSENILLTSTMCIKICDFGLSRSAEEVLSNSKTRETSTSGRTRSKKVLLRQYTKMVVTPSYRAPEVIMSRGQYSSAIDIWSLGCIFWELLIRSLHPGLVGPLAEPLFGVRGEPVTPEEGENYANDSHSPLAEQLDVIFNVIGTPCWKDIESVPSETWRAYLKCLPGRAGNLLKTLSGHVDDQALDLLSRMLAFDPARRCTAEEALAHVYFKNLKTPNYTKFLTNDTTLTPFPTLFYNVTDPATALGNLERELEDSVLEPDGGKTKLERLLQREVEEQQHISMRLHPFLAAPKQHLENRLVISPASHSSKQKSHHNTILPFMDQGVFQFPEICGQQPRYCQDSESIRFDDGGNQIQIAEGSETADLRPKRKLPRKTIIRQGSFCIEINNASPDVLPPVDDLPSCHTGAQFKRSEVLTKSTLSMVQQNQDPEQFSTMECNLSTQSASRPVAITDEFKAVETKRNKNDRVALNDQQDLGVLHLRRSPRFRDLQTNEIPLRKRVRMQVR